MTAALMIAIGAVAFVAAYFLHGRYLERRVFRADPNNIPPATSRQDNIDFVPTKKAVLFGHHFVTIAGISPILGIAIAAIWGWLPAFLWVIFGTILIGTTHDYGSLFVSMRFHGRSIGQLCNELINPRVRTLFLVVVLFMGWLVMATFVLVIAKLFIDYPESVIPVWSSVPLALLAGYMIYTRNGSHRLWGIIAVVSLYALVVTGSSCPVKVNGIVDSLGITPLTFWMLVLFLYSFAAGVLPVQKLLQPRDYLNANQLVVAMILLVVGVLWSNPPIVAPAINTVPTDLPPIWPILFVTIACGAVSGYHSIFASATTVRQLASEHDALPVGYGAMLLEGGLSLLALVAVTGGIGLGLSESGGTFAGVDAYFHHYASWGGSSGQKETIGVFVQGASNMIASVSIAGYSIPMTFLHTLLCVLLISFGSTSLDSIARAQRYVIEDVAVSCGLRGINRNLAAFIGVATAAGLAFASFGQKSGALILWPLFGCVNQILAALALMVLTIYLARRRAPYLITAVPMLFMLFITGWAFEVTLEGFLSRQNWLLFAIGMACVILEIWMVVECILVFIRRRHEPVLETIIRSRAVEQGSDCLDK